MDLHRNLSLWMSKAKARPKREREEKALAQIQIPCFGLKSKNFPPFVEFWDMGVRYEKELKSNRSKAVDGRSSIVPLKGALCMSKNQEQLQ